MKNIFQLFVLVSIFSLVACKASKNAVTTDSAVKEMERPTDAPGVISFEAANERYSANGKFNKWNFTRVNMDGNDITTLDAELNIDLTSIWEKSDKLTEHLKAWDYFDVEKFQNATVKIKNVRKKGAGYEADMELAMRDEFQRIESTFEVLEKKPLRVRGSAFVDRSIFGIGVENTSVSNLIKVTYDTVIPTK